MKIVTEHFIGNYYYSYNFAFAKFSPRAFQAPKVCNLLKTPCWTWVLKFFCLNLHAPHHLNPLDCTLCSPAPVHKREI